MDVFHAVGAVAPEADGTAAVHRDPHAGAIPQPVEIARDRFHFDMHVQPGQTLQLLGDAECLETPLGPDRHMLEVTAATATGSGMGARGRHPVG